MVGGVLGDQFRLLPGDIAGNGLTVFARLKVVVGALGTLADDAELARFHAIDLSHLLEDRLWR
jgi:hypothetical protein